MKLVCFTIYIFRMIKSRRMIWVVHIACMGEMRNAYIILAENLKGRST
jgi:hypothetical protein